MVTKMMLLAKLHFRYSKLSVVGINTEHFLCELGAEKALKGYCTKALSWTLYDKTRMEFADSTKRVVMML
jgi:ubiquinone/menaquinone biosynthesis C-methylase UbiE